MRSCIYMWMDYDAFSSAQDTLMFYDKNPKKFLFLMHCEHEKNR